MASKAIKERPLTEPRPAMREMAPSVLRTEVPRFARIIGMCGLVLVSVGGVTVLVRTVEGASRFSPMVGWLFLVLGTGCLLFHAASDNDMQVRRSYGLLSLAGIIAAAVLTLLAINNESARDKFLLGVYPCLLLGFVFAVPFIRHETDEKLQRWALNALGVLGGLLSAAGFIGGNVSLDFLIPHGLLLALAGLAFLWTFVVLHGIVDKLGYRAALAMGYAGIVVFLVAFGRSVLPELFYHWGWMKTVPEAYFIPAGLLLMGLGLLYALCAVGICSDNRLVVMTRRELAAYFYSPIAYVILFGFTALGALNFLFFLNELMPDPSPFMQRGPIPEPILQYYIVHIIPVVAVMFGVPALTMRLLSEENRSGTMEVLLTAPVGETTVVISKFLATFIFYMLAWVPWGLYLVALRLEGGTPFEYRPIITFFFALAASGAGFLAIGLFCSSLTRNQIIAFILGAVAMMFMLGIYYLKLAAQQSSQADALNRAWATLLTYLSFIDLWIGATEGKLEPKYLFVHLGIAVFFLFLTVKVLESRKWK